jgi:hypothetical protein
MTTIEQRLRGLVLELESLGARLEVEAERVDPHADRVGYEGAAAHLGEAVDHLRGALSCLVDSPHWD